MPPSTTHTHHTLWYLRWSVLIAAGLLAILVLVVVVLSVLGLLGGGCSNSEQAVLEEFPHYTDQRLIPYSAEVSCNARYTISASRDEVLGHYDEQLQENGWKVGGYWAANPPQGIEVFGEKLSDLEEAPEEGVRSGLAGRRDEASTGRTYSYSVEYYPPGSPAASAKGGGSEEEAMVMVSVTDEPGAGGKVK
jgi:hypothetical protein